jgi:hypothetical protein
MISGKILKERLRPWIPEKLYVFRKCLMDFHGGHGGYPNLFRPQTFSEKIQYRKLFDRRPILATLADKYAVREFIRQRVGEAFLTELHLVTEDPNDLTPQALPDQCVVKPTHGCGWIEIIRDKTTHDFEQLRKNCANWLAQNYFYTSGEWVYRHIPRRLIVEELLDDGEGNIPQDYKFFVFNGRVAFLGVDIDRFTDHRRNMYDRDWTKLNFGFQYPDSPLTIERPARFDEMVACAEALCAGFDFLRVDMYCLGDRLLVGEITTTPGSGLEPFWPAGTDHWIGRLWEQETQ